MAEFKAGEIVRVLADGKLAEVRSVKSGPMVDDLTLKIGTSTIHLAADQVEKVEADEKTADDVTRPHPLQSDVKKGEPQKETKNTVKKKKPTG